MDQVMTGAAELLALRPEVWSALFYPTLLENLPFNSVIATDYEGDIRALGDRVNITEFPQFDLAETIQEDQKVDADSVTAISHELVINKQIVKDYIITDRAKVQTIESEAALRNLVFHSIMRRMQQILIDATVPSAAAPDHQLTYTAGTTLALADILAAKELLDQQNVPDDGSRCMVLDAPQWNDLFNITGLTSSDFVSSRPNESGQPPVSIFGFNPKMTTEANEVSFFFHPQYQEMAVQRGLEVKVFDQGVEGKRSMRVNSSLLMGEEQISDIRVVTIS